MPTAVSIPELPERIPLLNPETGRSSTIGRDHARRLLRRGNVPGGAVLTGGKLQLIPAGEPCRMTRPLGPNQASGWIPIIQVRIGCFPRESLRTFAHYPVPDMRSDYLVTAQ
jgi:hypothetical protein